jgi:opacity protein-like surface antigen
MPLLACLLALLASRTAVAQNPDRNPGQTPAKKHFTPQTDLSAGIYGQLTNTRMPTTVVDSPEGVFTRQITQGTSDSPGVFATFHQSFKPWLGYNVNFGYSRFSENYSYGQAYLPSSTSTQPAYSNFAQGSIPTNMLDLTIAYVFRGPSNKKFSTFGQFGGGGLFFLPTVSTDSHDLNPVRQQTRPATIFGVGMNYKLTNRLNLRAEYRGLFYKCPDFTLPPYGGGNSFPMTKLFTVTNVPAVSLVYRFGGNKIHPSSANSR